MKQKTLKIDPRLLKMIPFAVTKDILEPFVSENFESDIKQAKSDKCIGFAVQ